MPVNFLTEEQAAQYGRYAGDPSPAQLAQYFYLDDTDRQFLRPLRGDRQQLGWAVQLGTLRFLDTFVEDWTTIPTAVIAYVAGQLAMAVPDGMARYGSSRTRREHTLRLTALYEYQPFEAQPGHWRVVRGYTSAPGSRPNVRACCLTGPRPTWSNRKSCCPG